MNEHIHVEGLMNTGTANVNGSAIGPGASVNSPSPQPQRSQHASDVGIITILPEETHAVVLALHLRPTSASALHFYEGEAETGSGATKIVAIQALTQGQRSTMAAYHNLCQHYNPHTVVLTGIGGGIRPDTRPGDVVVATRVVYYDLRKETPAGTQRRGEEHHAPAETSHSINAFFAQHDPAKFLVEDPGGTTRIMQMRVGLIGSGDAVIADREAEVLRYLASFNDKILAVDMESGGLSQACHEDSATTGRSRGWVVIRGISDNADHEKNDLYHHAASWHAAVALRHLLPYLCTANFTPRRDRP